MTRIDRISPVVWILPWILTGLGAPTAPVRASEPGAHAEASCGLCHAGRGWEVREASSPVSGVCGDCHAPTRNTFHRDVEGRCAGCHSFHDTDVVRLQGEPMARTQGDPSESAHCRACHRGGRDPRDLSEGHRAAGAWYHASAAKLALSSPSDACLVCHARGGQLPEESEAAALPPRFHAGASHPYGERMPRSSAAGAAFRLRAPEDPRVELVDGRIECITCHDLYSREDDKLVKFDARAQLCGSCHVRPGGEEEKLVMAR